MTAIVGIVHGPKVWIGGDSCVSDGQTREQTRTLKVWRAGGYLLGAAGNGAWFAALRRLRWPVQASAGYVLGGFVPDLVTAAGELGIALPAKEDGGASDGAVLIGGAGKLWLADSDLAVDEYAETAAGSGAEGARCVLSAVKTGGPAARIRRALEAVAAVRWDVAGPFVVESI